MPLTNEAASAAIQVVPVLALGVSAIFAYLNKTPRILRKVSLGWPGGTNPDHIIDLFAWLVGVALYVTFMFMSYDAILACFDVLQGNQASPDSGSLVRHTILFGSILLLILPATAAVLVPVGHLIGDLATLQSNRRQRKTERQKD